MTIQRHQLKINLPADAKAFIEREAIRNASSQNSEIVRCIRERMERIGEAIEQAERVGRAASNRPFARMFTETIPIPLPHAPPPMTDDPPE